MWLAERMSRWWVGLVVAGLAVTSCSGDDRDTVEITTTDSAGRTTVVTQQVTETPTDTSTGDAAPTTAALVATALELPDGSSIAFDMPDSWAVEPMPDAVREDPPIADAVPPRQWCLVPSEAPPAIDGCTGVLVAAGPDWLPGPAGTAYTPRQVDGWRSGAASLACPFGEDGQPADAAEATITPDEADATTDPTPDDSEVDLLVTASEGLPLTSVQTEVNGRQLTYETWRASCSLSEEVVINPQVWHDSTLGVLVKDYFGLPEIPALVESLRAA